MLACWRQLLGSHLACAQLDAGNDPQYPSCIAQFAPSVLAELIEQVLTSKAAAFLKAGKQQLVQRTTYLFKPSPVALATTQCFQPMTSSQLG